MEEFEIIAKTLQGLESLLAEELTALGANNIEIGRRMVSYTGNQEMLYRSNFCLRTALRILKPICHFRATTADEVYEAVRKIDWSGLMDAETTFAVDSVVYSQEFRHSKFVAYKVKDAIVDQFMEKTGNRPNIRVTNPDLQLHIHISEKDCTLSLDSSGESLHRRGYRQEAGEAPLNEVLAAGIVMLTGWRGECDLIDPMCGSGTIPIEAALIAKGIAPGVYRKNYAFEKWRDFDKDLFERIYNDDSQEREFTHKIFGYDIEREAAMTAARNVRAAGLSSCVSIASRDFKDFTQPERKSVMITNPPYGERMAPPDLTGLYKMIGERLKHQFVNNEAWILSYKEECFVAIGLKASLRIPVYNGALECELRKYQIFDGKYNDVRAEGRGIKTDWDRKQAEDRLLYKERNKKRGPRHEEEDDFRERPRYRHEDRDGRGYADRGERRYGDRGGNRHGDWRGNRHGERNDRRQTTPGARRGLTDRRQRQEERKRYFGTGRDFNTRRKYDEEED